MKIVISGRPGIGKTSLIKKLTVQITIPKCGFYTEEILNTFVRHNCIGGLSVDTDGPAFSGAEGVKNGTRVGFKAVSLDSRREVVLAHVDFRSLYKVGKMELFSGKFRGLILDILGSTETAIITTRTDLAEGWISKIKDKNCHHFELNRSNSEDVFGQIFKLIQP